jgi:integrase
LSPAKTTHFSSLTEPEEVAKLLIAIYGYQGSPIVSAALKLSALLFVRPGELRAARWSDIDLQAAEWRYTTSKTHTAHIVPLARQAIEVLEEVRPYSRRSEYVLPSVRSISKSISENTINAALRNLGFDGTMMTAHGFRAMARTLLDEVLGFRPDFIEHQLAHAVRDPLGRAYNRTTHLKERRKMMQGWADYLDNLRGQKTD